MNSKTHLEKRWVFVTSWRWQEIVRWLVVAAGFTMGSLGVLYVLKDRLGLPLAAATLLSAEIATLLRFFVNNRWVFDDGTATLRKLWQFHWANAGSFVIWWMISNLLPRYGMHYMVAATAGAAGSAAFGMLSNFLWIWRDRSISRRRDAESVKVVNFRDT